MTMPKRTSEHGFNSIQRNNVNKNHSSGKEPYLAKRKGASFFEPKVQKTEEVIDARAAELILLLTAIDLAAAPRP